jgi:YD repeat-containing protein
MVAIFTGAGAGFERGSASVLGGMGLLGRSSLGRGAEQLFLNAANGNFLVSRRDEFLVGRGPDAEIARTYNSLGDLSDENGDNWRQSTDRRIKSFVPGTSVKRVSGDGSEITYAFNGTVYTTTDGAGPHDMLAYDGGTNNWLWTDGGTQITEKYTVWGGEWKIKEQTDPAGNKINFDYDGSGKLIQVSTADGYGSIAYSWSGNNITQIVTSYTDLVTGTPKTLTRARYSYDAYNRLGTVTVDLTPGDNNIADNATYTTTYTYYGISKLVQTISQTDGSMVELGYDGSNRLTSITQTAADGATRITTVAYNAGSTAITDPTGQVVTLEYDTTTQALKKIIAPPAYAGAAAQTAQFSYSSTTGDVLSVTDGFGNVTGHSYDSQGNATSSTDRLGNVVTRTYGTRNELLTETRPGSSAASNATTLTTRYAYDAQLNLRFVVTPEGRVTQYLNDSYGQPYYRIVYTKDRYDVSALAASTPLTEAQLASWHAGLADKSAMNYDYTYFDQRGNIGQEVDYGGTDSAGNPITTDGYTHEYFTYDQAGQLLNRTTASLNTETFVYDGLGRLTASVDLNGGSTSFLFQDAQRQTVVTLANGLVETHTYNRAGELIASTKAGDFVLAGSATQHKYDKNGRLRMITEATGNDSYYLYDKAGRKIADINEAGWIVEYRYDANDRVIATTRYTNYLSTGQLATLADPNSTVEMSAIRPVAHAQDIWAWYVYDKEGRVLETIGGDGAAAVYEYDQAGRRVRTSTFSGKFDAAQIAGFKATPPTAIIYPQSVLARDIVIRSFYDKDGRQIGTLDTFGILSEVIYDAAGRKVEEARYYNGTISYYLGSGTFTQIKGTIAPHASDRRTRYVYDAQDHLRFTVNALNQVTGYGYESDVLWGAYGSVRQTIQYAGPIAALGSYTYASVKAAIAAAGLTNHVDNRISYSVYDTADRLVYSIDPAGGATGYAYDAEGQVTRIVRYASLPGFTSLPTTAQMDGWAAGQAGNGANRVTRQYYSDRGELRFTIDGEGYVTRFDYDAEGRTTREVRWTNPISVGDSNSIYSVNDLANASGTWVDKNFAYDATGKLIWTYDGEGNHRYFSYYANGTLAWDVAMLGTQDQSRTLFVYDASGRMIERHDAYDTINAVTQYVYDGQGNIVTVIDPRGNSTYIYYNKVGQEVCRRDAEDHVTDTFWTQFGEIAWTRRRYNKATNAASAAVNPIVTTNAWDAQTVNIYDKLGRVAQTNDAANFVTTNTYNVFGDLISVTRGAATTSFEYDKAGRLKKTTDAQTYYQQYGLNAFGEKETVRNKVSGVTVNAYDRRGLLVSETLPMASVDHQGNILAATVLNKFEYDSRGNRSKKIEAFGLPEQRTTSYFYDKADRLIESRGDSVYATDQNNYQTQTLVAPSEKFKYDGRGNVIEQTDALGARSLVYYDQLNRVSAEIDPLGTYTSYTYDKNGNRLTGRVHATPVAQPATPGGAPPSPPAGEYRETNFTYDKLNRVKTHYMTGIRTGAWNGSAYATAVGTVTFASYDYDARDNVIKTTDGNGGMVFSFFNKINQKYNEIDQENYLTSWIYDIEGNVLSERRYATRGTGTAGTGSWVAPANHADDRVTVFTYDKNGRRLTEQRTGVVTHSIDPANGDPLLAATAVTVYYTYNGLGQVTRKTESTGDYTDYVYDSAGRLEQEIRAPFVDVSTATVRPTVRYSYNGLNNLTMTRQGGQTVAAGDRFTRYTYGAGGRLATTTDADLKVQSYFYDAAGNIVRASYVRAKADTPSVDDGVLYTRDLLGRTLSQALGTWNGSTWVKGDVQSMAYNAYGDLAQRGMNGMWQEQFAYDTAGRLWRSNSGDGVWRFYVHDGNRNQTLAIESEGTNLANMTIDQALAAATANGSVGGGYVDGVNASINVFDKRGQASQTRKPFRQLDASNIQALTASRTYNAFGEVMSETDARNYITNFTYNTMGRLIEKKSPTVNYTAENGAVSSARPTETYYYDVSGRMIGIRDANGYRNTRILLAGTGYGSSEAMVTAEHRADGGVFRTYYDVFGDARILRNERGYDEARDYDAMGRLITQVHRGGLLTDHYTYDLLGQRITHWNSHLGPANVEVTEYDAQGRVTRQVAFGGDITATNYAWDPSLATGLLGTFGGWTQTTTYANSKTLIESTDTFGHVLSRRDLGFHLFTYDYDRAGRIASQAVAGETLAYGWLNSGLLGSIGDGAGGSATYGYDAAGNKLSEYTLRNYGVVQNATAAYDAMGRMTNWAEAGNATAPASSTAYEYDLVGNFRHTSSTQVWLDQQGAPIYNPVVHYWYRYDPMNRVTLDKGTFSGSPGSGSIVGGTAYTYDAAGNRRTATSTVTRTNKLWKYVPSLGPPTPRYYSNPPENYPDDGGGQLTYIDYQFSSAQVETYTYNEANHLTNVGVAVQDIQPIGPNGTTSPQVGPLGASITRGVYNLDAMGRVYNQIDYAEDGTSAYDRTISYNAKGQSYSETIYSKQGTETWRSIVGNEYGAGTGYALGSPTSITTSDSKLVSGSYQFQFSTTTTNNYDWYDGAVQSTMTVAKTSQPTYTTTYYYSPSGQLTSIYVGDGRPRTITFTNDMNGLAIRRDEADSNYDPYTGGDPHEVWYRFNGRQMAFSGNNGSLDTDYATSIVNRAKAPGNGAFRFGATSGPNYTDYDPSLDRINSYSQGGAGGSYTVRAGDTFASIALNLWGDASLWYKLAEANGISASNSLFEGQRINIPAGVTRDLHNASTFRPFDPADTIGDVSPTSPKPAKKANNKCGVFGAILLIVIAVAVSALTYGALGGVALTGWSAVGAGAVAGAAGSIASQAVGLATGIQDKFSWKGVALAAIGGAIGGGLGPKGLFGPHGAFSGVGSSFVQGALRGAVGNLVTQGIATATGLQKKFDWAGVAAAAVGGGVAGWIGARLPADTNKYAGQLLIGSASAIAGAATRTLVDGSDFGDNLIAALPDVIGATIGNMVADGFSQLARSRQHAVLAEYTGMGGPQEFEVQANGQSFTFSEGGDGTTYQVILAGYDNPLLLLDLANKLNENGISVENTIADVRSELNNLDESVRYDVAQRVYNALHTDAVTALTWVPANDQLEALIIGFDLGIGNSLVGEGRIYHWANVRNPMNHQVYVVGNNDTLSGIASRLDGVSTGYLASINNLANPDSIRAGSRLIIPNTAYVSRLIRLETALFNLLNDPNGASIPQAVRDFDPYTGFATSPYGRFGSMASLQGAAGAEYQRLVDIGYARGVERWEAGLLDGRNRNQAIGTYMDSFARLGMNDWFANEGIFMGRDGVAQVYVNRRLNNPNGWQYRIPDLRVGDRYFDASLASKSFTTPQIRDFYRFGNPSMVTITRPTALGGAYNIPRPPGR